MIEKAMTTHPVLLPGRSHGGRSLVGCSPWGRKESDTTERLPFHFFSFIHWRRKWQPTPVFLHGESQRWGSLVGAVYEVAQSRTWQKQLSSSSSIANDEKVAFSWVHFSHSVVSNSSLPHGLQNTRLPCPSPTPAVCSNSHSSSLWCHPTISSSVDTFSSCFQSFPASGSFPMSQFFSSGGQSFGVSASASVLPMSIQDWFPLGWTGWISLQSKGLSRDFSSTTVWKHQFLQCSAFFMIPILTFIHDY